MVFIKCYIIWLCFCFDTFVCRYNFLFCLCLNQLLLIFCPHVETLCYFGPLVLEVCMETHSGIFTEEHQDNRDYFMTNRNHSSPGLIALLEADYTGLPSWLAYEVWGWQRAEMHSCNLSSLTSNHLQPVFQSTAYHCWKAKRTTAIMYFQMSFQ